MTKKVFNMAGGLHSAAAYAGLENRAYGSCVASATSFVVSAGTGMNASISAGDGLISVDANSAKRIQTDATETVAVAAASTSYARIDTIVAYIDNAVTPTTSVVDNTNGVLKFKSVAGTAAATPVAPTAGAIQASIGAGNPYMVLYNVTIPQNATNLTAATFTDVRKVLTVIDPANIPAKSITGGKIADSTVARANIDKASFPNIMIQAVREKDPISWSIPAAGVVLVQAAGRIGTSTAGVGMSVSGTAYVSGDMLQNLQNDADFIHIPAYGAFIVKAGTLNISITGTDNRGILATYIPVVAGNV